MVIRTFNHLSRDHEIGDIAGLRDFHSLKNQRVRFSETEREREHPHTENCNIDMTTANHSKGFTRIWMSSRQLHVKVPRFLNEFLPNTEAPGSSVTVSFPALIKSL